MSTFRNLMAASASGGGGKLPSEYQEVEWIGSTAGDIKQYINTGVRTTPQIGVSIKIKCVCTGIYTKDQVAVGVIGGAGNWAGVPTNKTVWGLGVSNLTTYNCREVTEMTIGFGTKATLTIDGRLAAERIGYVMSSADITLFSYADGSYGGYFNIYHCEIKKDDIIVRNFVPCYRKSDNEIGMYDMVNGVFYTNAGTGTFTKGADVNK